jgi:peptide/nickel transport system permease protein
MEDTVLFQFIFRRTLHTIPVLLGVSIVVFFGMHVVPGDVAQMILGDKATPEALKRLTEELGLNQPVLVQYWRFISHAVIGDFGTSIRTANPVWHDIWLAFPVTVQLATMSLVFALLVGIPIGVQAAVKQNKWFDNLAMVGVLVGISMPVFWVALVLMLYVGVKLDLLPISGIISDGLALHRITGMTLVDAMLTCNFVAFWDSFKHMILATMALGTIPTAIIARITRMEMIDVLKHDYIRTAWAKGLRYRYITYYHALKNALIPVITVCGLSFGGTLGGAILTETVFGLPGMGRLAVNSILYRDYPEVQGIVMISSVAFVIVNLIVDILYAVVDPRIRLDKEVGA